MRPIERQRSTLAIENRAHDFGFRHIHSLFPALLGLLLILGCSSPETLDDLRKRQDAGDFASTVEPLRARLDVDPADGETNYLYGRALVASREPELAIYALRQAMDDPEWLEIAGLQLAIAGLTSGDFRESVAAATRVLEADPTNVDALLYRAQAHAHWKQDSDQALEDAEQVLDLDPDRLEAYEPRILALLSLGLPENAAEALDEAGRRLVAADAAPDQLAWHCSTLAVFATDDGRSDEAETIWERCVLEHPGNPAVVDGAMRFFDAKQRFARSLEILEAAVENEPRSRAYRTTLTSRYRLMGRVEEAETLLRKAVDEAKPGQRTAHWSDLGEHFHKVGTYTEAAEAFRKAVEFDQTSDANVAFRYADALVLAGEFDLAVEQGDRLPIEAHRLLIHARVDQERGNYAAALDAFVQAATLWPNNPWSRYYAGLCAEQLGQWDRALEEYRYSVRIDAGATDSRTRGAQLLTLQKEPALAYQMLFLQAAEHPLEPEGMILGAYLIAKVSNPAQLKDDLSRHLRTHPSSYPRALVRAAQGVAENEEAVAAMTLLDGAPGIHWTSPEHAPVLLAFVRHAHDAGKPERAEKAVSDALRENPKPVAGVLLAKAVHLERSGAPDARVQEGFEAALRVEPAYVPALETFGDWLLTRDPEAALVQLDRAASESPGALGPRFGVARALVRLGRDQEAMERLDQLLADFPLAVEAAAQRADLDVARDAISEHTLDLARRAARGQRDAESYDRLEKIFRALGDAENARFSKELAEKLRS